MRILITGSSGFIGAALARKLAEAGHEIVPMDLRGEGAARGDVTNESDCRRSCQDVDVVVHGAAVHQAQQVRRDPDAVMAVNVGGARALLDAAHAGGVRRFVYLSTAKVYGEPLELPSRESDPLRPQDPYAISKLATEEFCREHQFRHGIEMAIVRPFSVYGPGQDLDTGYVGMLLGALRNGVAPILPGQPDFLRDFVHIDDLVDVLTACVTRPLPGLTIVNAASGRARTLASLVDEFSRLAGRSMGARYRDPSADTIRHSCGDTTELERRFGLTPRVSVAEGLAGSLQWCLGETQARMGSLP